MKTVNNLTDVTPLLTDKTWTIRGTSTGAEKRSTFQAILDLFRSNRNRVVSLVASSSIATDASLGEIFDLTTNQSFTLQTPTNGTHRNSIMWCIRWSGTHTITLGAGFRIPSSATTPLPWSSAAGKMDKLVAQYDSTDGKWDVVSMIPGYSF